MTLVSSNLQSSTDGWSDPKEFWRNRRTMVTGGNGFLGRHLVRKLREREADVFIVCAGQRRVPGG